MGKVIERHQDYILSVAPLANGATARNVELRTDSDAPFCVRQVGGYQRDGLGAVTGLNGGFLQWADPDERYLQSELTGITADMVVSGVNAQYSPVYNQRVFPAESVLMFNITNSSGSDWGRVNVIFRGSKLFYEGDCWSPTYPDCFQSIPWEQVLNVSVASNTTLRDQIFQVGNDADLALRGAVCNETSAAVGNDVDFRLKDYQSKYYSNGFINWKWLFSSIARRPSMFYPELYIPSKEIFSYDVRQNVITETATFNLNLIGAKVFKK